MQMKIQTLLKILLVIVLVPLHASVLTGKKFESVEMTDLLTGQTISDQALPNEPYLVHFWSSWCHTCHSNHANMLKAAQKYPVIGIIVSDDSESITAWLEENSNPYLYILNDEDSQFAMDLHIPFTPYTLLIDGNGEILKEQSGVIEDINEFLWVK